jgi:hypothetical protein
MKTMAYGKVGGSIVTLLKRQKPSDADWDQYVALIRMLPPGQPYRVLVWSLGGSPTPEQRKRLDDVIGGHQKTSRVAVISDSMLVRGIVSAMRVVQPMYQSFSPSNIESAFRYLELSEGEIREASALVKRLQREIGEA